METYYIILGSNNGKDWNPMSDVLTEKPCLETWTPGEYPYQFYKVEEMKGFPF